MGAGRGVTRRAQQTQAQPRNEQDSGAVVFAKLLDFLRDAGVSRVGFAQYYDPGTRYHDPDTYYQLLNTEDELEHVAAMLNNFLQDMVSVDAVILPEGFEVGDFVFQPGVDGARSIVLKNQRLETECDVELQLWSWEEKMEVVAMKCLGDVAIAVWKTVAAEPRRRPLRARTR